MKGKSAAAARAAGCILICLCLGFCGCGGYDSDGVPISVIRAAANNAPQPFETARAEDLFPIGGSDAPDAVLPEDALIPVEPTPETTLPDPSVPPEEEANPVQLPPEENAAQTEENATQAEEIATQPAESETQPQAETAPAAIEPPAERETTAAAPERPALPEGAVHVVINTSSGKYHLDPDCASAKKISAANRLERDVSSVEALEAAGYSPCGRCSANLPAATTAKAPEPSADPPVDRSIDAGREGEVYSVVLNTSSRKIHLKEDCRYVASMKESNKKLLTLTREELDEYLTKGWTLCKGCSDNYK